MIEGFLWGYVKSRAGNDEASATILQQALNSGRIDGDAARALCENAPRFVHMLIEGLRTAYGKLTVRQFVQYAERGMIHNAAIHAAMR